MPDASWSSSTPAGASTSSDSSPASSIERLNGLLHRVAQKDRKAFALLYEATSAKLYGTVLRILPNKGLADDVVQEAYVNIWQKASQFDAGRASPITWMVTIARHRAIDEVRRQPTMRMESDDVLDHTPASDPTVHDQLHHEQQSRRLHLCLEELEKGRRDMVRLAYLDGWSRAELAAHFDEPLGTVKSWLHRALKQLKGCLAS